jgi:hypothetical protein
MNMPNASFPPSQLVCRHRSKGCYTVDKLDPAAVTALPLPPEPESLGEEGEAEP